MIILIFIFLIWYTSNQTDSRFKTKYYTNGSKHSHQILITFRLQLRLNGVLLFGSNEDLDPQTMDEQDLKLKIKAKLILFLIRSIYYASSQQDILIENLLTYKKGSYKSGCMNDCKGYNNTESVSKPYCQNSHCECQMNQFGQTQIPFNENFSFINIAALICDYYAISQLMKNLIQFDIQTNSLIGNSQLVQEQNLANGIILKIELSKLLNIQTSFTQDQVIIIPKMRNWILEYYQRNHQIIGIQKGIKQQLLFLEPVLVVLLIIEGSLINLSKNILD
ncbi:unnamed protein product [Paramecium octaurelia]|uniref:Transmembrane protein n=1 Tax=Paramecium octaurelia TaxID=43137 RepID=A0A8S1V6J5_PAROT|nr:unnamed protein product [Paramecium octaurelia]